jgi:hypothetical protein
MNGDGLGLAKRKVDLDWRPNSRMNRILEEKVKLCDWNRPQRNLRMKPLKICNGNVDLDKSCFGGKGESVQLEQAAKESEDETPDNLPWEPEALESESEDAPTLQLQPKTKPNGCSTPL